MSMALSSSDVMVRALSAHPRHCKPHANKRFRPTSGCRKNHLIADNLGWFQEGGTNIEHIMQEKGLEVTRVMNSSDAGCASETQREYAPQPQLVDNSVFEVLGTPETEN
jgi:hypothetical protein